MQTINLNAICLKAYPYSETSKIALYWTREQGECRAMVKGVRKANSPLASACEVLTHQTVTVRPGRNLAQVQQVASIQGFPQLRRELLRISAAAMLAEWLLCNRLEPQPADLFDWLLQALHQLEALASGQLTALVQIVGEAQSRLLQLTGHPLQLKDCLHCAGSLFNYPEPVYFSQAWGSAICQSCYHHKTELRAIGLVAMSASTLHVLNDPCEATWTNVDPIRLQKFWLFLARQWWHQPLPAHEFWLQQLRVEQI